LTDNRSRLRRWAPHFTFGLREEWLDLALSRPHDWADSGDLGTKQIASLKAWLKTTGLSKRECQSTPLLDLFHDPDGRSLAWQIVWVNSVFNFAIAFLYVRAPRSEEWSTKSLAISMLPQAGSLRPRTIRDGVQELIGLLERTPVGTQLGQGIVTRGRPRRVHRIGLPYPDPRALAHAARRLFLWENLTSLPLEADLVWPWTVFACDKYDALSMLDSPDYSWLAIHDTSLECTTSLEDLEHVALF